MKNAFNSIPNLFLIGSAKCATTSIHDVLSRHELIYMSKIKEPNYFARSDFQNKYHWYMSFFEECSKNVKYIGESSPFYSNTFLNPNIANRIYDFNPDAKIIYVVRNPLDRLKSVYVQGMSTGHWMEDKIGKRLNINHRLMPRNFEDAVLEYRTFIDETKYYKNISEYVRLFGRDNVLLLFYEDLRNDSSNFYQSIFKFLRIPKFEDERLYNERLNIGSQKRMIRPAFNKLSPAFQNNIRRIFPPFLFRYIKTKSIPKPVYSDSLKKKILEELKEEIGGILEYGDKPSDFWKF